MKKIVLTLCALVIVGAVVVTFGDQIEHLIEGGEHQSEDHAKAEKHGRDDGHGHGAEAKETEFGHGKEEREHAAKGKDDGHGHKEKEHDEKGHGEKGHGDEESSEVRLTAKQVTLAGIKSVEATLGRIDLSIDLAGEVHVNQDRVVHVVPRVPGVVRSVKSYLGDKVEKGTVMAVLDSRELADAKSAYVAAHERRRLASSNFKREERLWKKKISSEQEYLNAKSTLAEAQIVQRAALQQLRALGNSPDVLKRLTNGSSESFTRYEVRAPLAGTIIEKHVTNGASVDHKEPIFRIADLEKIWVIASVYEKDIARIDRGQTASIKTKAYPDRTFEGRLTWVSDTIDERTRTLKVRIEVNNAKRLLKPGMFVRASVIVDAKEGVLSIPASAVRRQGGETIVFVDEGGGRFERRDIEIGVQTGDRIEVRKGVRPGQRVVSAGSFILKSELEKEGFEAGHAH